MRVLIGVDGSEGAWHALDQIGQLISPDRDKIALYYAPPRITFRRHRQPEQTLVDATRQALIDGVFQEATLRLPAAVRDRAERIVDDRAAREHIAEAAEKWKADLIVVGARGTSRLTGMVLGSVARSLLRSSRTPVLVGRPKRDKSSDSTYSALLAVDRPSSLPSAADFVRKVTWPADSSGRLIHIVPPLFGAEVPVWLEERARKARDESLSQAWVEEFAAEKRHSYEEMVAYARQLPAPFSHSPPILLEGVPADKIIETAFADDVDLVIVFTRDSNSFERFMIGSTAEKVLQHCPCSVLALHAEPA